LVVLIALFAVTFVLSAVGLALWIDRRFPRLAPSDLKVALLHLVVAALANQLLDGPLSRLVAGSSMPHGRVVAVVGVVLPLVAYAALAAFWTLRIAQRALSGSVR
jgi:hypothetical protein